jgi:hypothetical protein
MVRSGSFPAQCESTLGRIRRLAIAFLGKKNDRIGFAGRECLALLPLKQARVAPLFGDSLPSGTLDRTQSQIDPIRDCSGVEFILLCK